MEEIEIREIRERKAEIRRGQDTNRDRLAVLSAQHRKRVFTENDYSGVDYNSRHVLRQGDVTISLSMDEEYTSLLKQQRDLEYEDDMLSAKLPEDES